MDNIKVISNNMTLSLSCFQQKTICPFIVFIILALIIINLATSIFNLSIPQTQFNFFESFKDSPYQVNKCTQFFVITLFYVNILAFYVVYIVCLYCVLVLQVFSRETCCMNVRFVHVKVSLRLKKIIFVCNLMKLNLIL